MERNINVRYLIAAILLLLLFLVSCLYVFQFQSFVDLHFWLVEDDTDSLMFIPNDYNCKHFSVEIFCRGLRDGKVLLPIITWEGTWYPNHMRNITVAGGKLYWVEPQEDIYWRVT